MENQFSSSSDQLSQQQSEETNSSLHRSSSSEKSKSPNQLTPSSSSSSNCKVLTPGYNMLVNPQNPSAPPVPICGNCQKETRDNDEIILCESGCNFWYHRQCVGLTEDAYKLLKAEIFAEWVCDHCLATKSIPPVKMKS